MEWLPSARAVEARHAHLLAEAERRRLVRLARRAEAEGTEARTGARGCSPRPVLSAATARPSPPGRRKGRRGWRLAG